jgi:uncharacterized protein YcfJ
MKSASAIKSVLLASLLSLTACSSQAGHRHHDHYGHPHRGYIDARVVDVAPVYREVERRVPVDECWTEAVERPVYSPGYRESGSMTSTIVGGLIGGAIGNAVGHSNTNKKVGAVAGAALGASVANDLSRSRSGPVYSGSEVVHEQRCTTRYETTYAEDVIGYDVAYRVDGRIYHTRTHAHPGSHIRVQIGGRY